uniref:Bacterial surface antigen (D15) domain-containing protein n=1 Tax=Riptortus pedestris TaxID=329032 RepID=R4WD89_RIPPE|nr:conserved hypothetical protein [Riptortus pedestris]
MIETIYAKEQPRKGPLGFNRAEVPLGQGGPCDEPPKSESKAVNLEGITARVDRVTVEGLSRTKDDIITKAVQDLFTASNFEEVIKKAHTVRQNLQSLNCFRSIAIHIDTSSGHGSSPDGYEVTYQVSELKRVTGGVTTSVSDNAGVLTIGGFFPNLYGRGESLRGEFSYGSNKSNNTNISFVKPFISKYSPVITLSAFGGETDYPASGFSLAENGLLTDLSFINNSVERMKHKLQYESNWRRLGVGRQSSFFVRNKTGSTLKSCIRHIATLDKRDNPILPICGSLVQIKTELAGLGGNVNFVKNEVNLQLNYPLYDGDVVIQGGLNVGVLNPLSDEDVNVADAFYLGGPTSLRGFEPRAVGPKQDDNYVGANMYWSAAIHCYSPLPFRPAYGGFGDFFKLHTFINCGNIGQFNTSDPQAFWDEQKDQIRVAAGLGIAVKLGTMARAELNYCFPLKAGASDGKVEGVQFGIGIDFL